MISVVLRVPCRRPLRFARTGVFKRSYWWPKAGRFRKQPRSPGPGRGASITGCEPMCTRIVRTAFAMRRVPDAPRSPRRSRTPVSYASSAGTRCVWAIVPPAGRCRYWRITSSNSTPVRSRLVPCGAGCETWICVGNVLGMSTRPRIRTEPRKKGAGSPPETDARASGAAVFGCDDPPLVSAPALCLGVSRRTSPGQDYGPKCQTGPVRHDQSTNGTPGSPASAPPATGGLPSLPAGVATTLSGSADLAVAGPSLLSPGHQKPTTGCPIGRDSLVAAEAVPGIEFAGPSLEGVEAVDRGQSSIPDD